MKRFATTFLLLLLCACLLCTVAFAAKETENNDTSLTAQAVSFGQQIDASIPTTSDVDFYKFTLPESGRVQIDLTSYMEWYTVRLYDIEGQELYNSQQNKWDAAVGFRKDTRSFDLAAGVYIFKFSGTREGGYSTKSTGNYNFVITFEGAKATEVEANNNYGTANTVSFDTLVTGFIALNDPQDFFRFTIPQSGTVTLDLTSYMEWYTIRLYNESGDEVSNSQQNKWNAAVGFRQDVRHYDLSGGVYVLKVTGTREGGYSTRSTGRYTFTVSFKGANATEKEPNNDLAFGNSVAFNKLVTGFISLTDSQDFFRFTLPQTGCLGIDLTSYMEWYTVRLYDDQGHEYFNSQQNKWNAAVGFRNDTYALNLNPGVYVLKITGAREGGYSTRSTGRYTFELSFEAAECTETEPNNTIAEANLLLNNGTHKGFIAIGDPIDFYRISISQAGTQKFTVCSYMKYYTFSIYNSEGKQLLNKEYNEISYDLGYREDEYQFTFDAPGSYYIKITGYRYGTSSGSTGRYLLSMNHDHKFSSWKVVTKPTMISEGLQERECACGKVEKQVLDMLPPFTDVPGNEWYALPVYWAVENGITNGVSSTRFGPNETCTRGQVVTFLWRAAGEPEPKSMSNPFSDIRSKDYYYKAVLWAVENGITTGTGKGKFSPDSGCTRGQVVTFLYRYAKSPAVSGTSAFKDVPNGAYYYNPVIWAVKNNITTGLSASSFAPDNLCTRAQIVTFLYRYMGK